MSDARPTAETPGRIRPSSRRDRQTEVSRVAPDPVLLGRQFRRLRHRHDELLRQLRLAEQVQRSLLPRPLPTPPHAELAAGLRPTQHLAGDFYNAFRLDGDHVGFYVGDVMGHGPAAALLAVFALMTIRTKRIDGNRYEIRPPAEVLTDLNHTLLEADIPGQPFLTLVYGILDTKERTWTYCNGGHPHPLVLGPSHDPILLDPTGPLLGVLQLPFDQAVVPMETGDRVVLYSDGALTAHWGNQGDGIDGLIARMSARCDSSLQSLIDETLGSVSFDAGLADDIAILAVELQD